MEMIDGNNDMGCGAGSSGIACGGADQKKKKQKNDSLCLRSLRRKRLRMQKTGEIAEVF
jgi:hypothetical protein